MPWKFEDVGQLHSEETQTARDEPSAEVLDESLVQGQENSNVREESERHRFPNEFILKVDSPQETGGDRVADQQGSAVGGNAVGKEAETGQQPVTGGSENGPAEGSAQQDNGPHCQQGLLGDYLWILRFALLSRTRRMNLLDRTGQGLLLLHN